MIKDVIGTIISKKGTIVEILGVDGETYIPPQNDVTQKFEVTNVVRFQVKNKEYVQFMNKVNLYP